MSRLWSLRALHCLRVVRCTRARRSLVSMPFRFRSFSTARLGKEDRSARKRFGDPTNLILKIENLQKTLPMRRRARILTDINVSFFHGAKVGLLGINGSGKSTLLRIIAGVDKEYEGRVVQGSAGLNIGFLQQEPELDENKTVEQNVMDGLGEKFTLVRDYNRVSEKLGDVYEEFESSDVDLQPELDKLLNEQESIQNRIEELNCWDLHHRVVEALRALRCPPGQSSVTQLSGGERRRVALCRLVLSEPDILLLDEPTNHLDAESVAWLERFLINYRGLVIAVTHDRYFLDNVVGWILEIDNSRAYPFKGNYESWLEAKSARLDTLKVTRKKQARALKRELQWIKSTGRGQQRKGTSRTKKYDKLLAEHEIVRQKAIERQNIGLVIPPGPRLGKNVIKFENVGVKFDGKCLFMNLSMEVSPGAVVGIIGPNGAGKTTFLRLIVKEKEADEGTITIGTTVQCAYSSQSRDNLNPKHTIFQEICGSDEMFSVGHNNEVFSSRRYVGQFAFKDVDQEKKIGDLSGGERNRVQLAKSLYHGCNVLILDEPTNDLDVDTLRGLEDALVFFEGTALVVSHDRWFLNRVCTHILAFPGDGSTKFFDGNYHEYETWNRKHGKQTTSAKMRQLSF